MITRPTALRFPTPSQCGQTMSPDRTAGVMFTLLLVQGLGAANKLLECRINVPATEIGNLTPRPFRVTAGVNLPCIGSESEGQIVMQVTRLVLERWNLMHVDAHE